MIAALLAMLLPAVLLAGGDSTTYYAALKAQVSSSGGGKVYASTSSSTPSSSSFGSGNTAQNSGSSSSFTFYAHAQANEGYKFKNWTGDFSSTDNPYTASVTATSTSSSTYTTKTITANFEPLPPATVTFAAPNNGSYTVNGETVNAQLVKANQAVPYFVTLVATPATNFRFAGWYVLDGGVKSFFSTDASTTKKFDVDVTVGAEFIPDGYAIYAAVAAKGYDDLATALAEAQSGESISVYSSATLNETAAVGAGVSLTVASGVTLTVASGATLYIDGPVTVNGTISGTVSKCTKLIRQTGKAEGKPFNPYGDVKYWKTSISTPDVSYSTSQTHATIVNGLGTVFRYSLSSSAKLIKCTIDSSVAVNHIKSIAGESTSVNVVNDTLNSGMVILLSDDCVINGGLSSKTGFRGVVDCANYNCATVSGVEVSGNNGKATFLNCPSFTGRKVINITHDYFNCGSVTLSSFNAGGSPILNFYDCGTFASPASFSASFSKGPSDTAKFNFYSGYYNSITYKTGYKVYGGSYKSNPATYIADQDNYEAVYDSGSKYYNVQEKTTVANVAAINGTEFETLSAAIAAAGNGATIDLIEGVDLTGTTVEVPSSKNITIVLNKHSINGGKIVNNGTLLITDVSIVNESNVKCDIENNGTLDFVFGTYSGAIVNKAGTLTTHNGVFTGTLTKDGGTVNLKGGHFTADVTAFVTAEGYDVFKDADNRFCVCELPNGTMYDTTVSSTAGYGATPYNDADFSVLYSRVKSNKTSRSDYSDANWKRLAQLLNFYQIFSNRGLDATIVFDRDVAKNSINLYAKSTAAMTVDFKYDLPAGQLYRALSEVVVFTYGYYAKTYFSIFDENIKSVAMAVSDKSGNNNGTLCKAMVELWKDDRAPDYSSTGHKITNTVYIAGQKLFTLGAGSNAAMIRPATGAATFYATLGAAMNAVADGGTVMLANDCDTALTLNKAGTYTFDTMGFAYSGGEPAVGSGLKIVSQTTVDSSAKVLVPDAAATTYVIENAGTIECGETKYVSIEAAVEASSGDMIAVTVTADDTETVTLPQGKTLTVTVNDGVEANVTVNPGEGSFIETETSGSTTTYVAKQITVEMAEPQSQVEVVKVDHGVTNEVSDASLVNEAVHALTGNHDVSRTDNTDKLDVLDKITVTPTKIVEEVVGADTIIRSVTFDVVPHLHVGQSLGEGQTLKFRLPVDAAATQLASIVYHVGEQFGIYPVQTYAGEKFIEVTSADFSPYSYELLDGETSNPIAAIGTTGYASLAAAVAAASAGDTVTLLADDTVSLTGGAEITINKSLSITGPVAANGDPLYTIYGKNTAAGYNDIFITGDGTVTLSNVKIAQFGNNAASDSGHAPVYVSQDFTGTVNLGNVYISEFNRAGVVLGGGTFNVTDCYIDCAQSRSGAFTKGIEIKGSATGTVKDTVIVNMERSSTASDAPAGIEVYGNGSIVVDGCTIISDVDPHQSGKATYGIVSSRVGVHDPSGGTLLVTNCSIDVSNGALSVADSDEYGPVNDYTIVVGGEDTYFGNYIAIWSAGSEITINEGEFTEDVYADAGTITITGGTFNNFLPDTGTGTIAISGGIFDAPVAEQYCADGYIPSYDPDTELYTVKQGAYVARNIDTGVGYETLAAAVSAATAGDTIVLLADIVDYTGTTLVSKSLTINGAGHSITAAAVPEGGHRDMINAFTGGTSMLKIGGGAVTVTNITFNGHATHAYTYLIEVVNSGASLTVGDISLVNGGELDNSGTPGAGYGAAIHVNNASIVVKDGFYACTGGAEYGVFPFTGILPEGNSSVMFDLVEDSDDTPTVDIDDDLLLVGMIGAIDPDTAQAILDYMQVPSRFIPYTLTLGDGSDYAFTGASPRTWNDIIDYGKKIMDVSTSLGYESLDKESTPVEVGLLTDTELPGTFVFEDANFTVNGNGHELTGTIKYTASAGELKNVILTSDTILDISADGAAVNFGDNVTGKAGEAVTLVVGELSAGQTLATHVDGLSLDSVVLKTWDGDNLVDAAIPEGLVLIKVDGNLIIAAAYEITWVSEGEILAVDVVISNTVPVYAGEPPVKDADDNGIYIFRGWTPKVEAAVSNTTYTANFSNSCTIRWMTGDTIVKSVSVTNGTPAAEIAALAPSGASSPDGNARFAGWSPAVYADALGDADYIAQFEALDTLASIVPGTLRFTAIKVNGRKVAVTFEFKPAGGETDAYRLICKTALDSAETFVSDIANVTLINDDANISIAIAEVQLPEGCENQAFVTGLDFVDVE